MPSLPTWDAMAGRVAMRCDAMRWEDADEMEVETKGEGGYGNGNEEEEGDDALRCFEGIGMPELTWLSMDEMGVGGVEDRIDGKRPGEMDGLNIHGHGDGLAAYRLGHSAAYYMSAVVELGST